MGSTPWLLCFEGYARSFQELFAQQPPPLDLGASRN
jgi:hypothetical protein